MTCRVFCALEEEIYLCEGNIEWEDLVTSKAFIPGLSLGLHGLQAFSEYLVG